MRDPGGRRQCRRRGGFDAPPAQERDFLDATDAELDETLRGPQDAHDDADLDQAEAESGQTLYPKGRRKSH